jgi:hypothetical protein
MSAPAHSASTARSAQKGPPDGKRPLANYGTAVALLPTKPRLAHRGTAANRHVASAGGRSRSRASRGGRQYTPRVNAHGGGAPGRSERSQDAGGTNCTMRANCPRQCIALNSEKAKGGSVEVAADLPRALVGYWPVISPQFSELAGIIDTQTLRPDGTICRNRTTTRRPACCSSIRRRRGRRLASLS